MDAAAAAREPAAPDSLDQLTIERIELIPVVIPLDREYRGSFYGMRNRATIITRVHTVEGVVGVAYAGDEDGTLREIVGVVESEIAPRLIGMDAFGYERCWELGYPATFDQLRDRRIGLVALAGVDLAIWDAVAKAAGRPLWQLWGGYRDRIPVNIIGGYYGRDLAGIRDEVAEWRDMGFRGCKFKVGGRSPAEDADRVRAAREAAGDDFVITIDANQGYTLAQALELCDRVRELDIRWFEEPCVWSNDRRDMREVRARGGIPVCAGQSEYSPGALSRPDGGRRDRRLQLRRVLVGRLHQLEADGGAVAALQRRAGASRGAAGGHASARQPAQRHLRRGLPPRPRPDLVATDRQPWRAGRR